MKRLVSEGARVAGALGPPARGGVDHGQAAGPGQHAVGEVPDPADHGGGTHVVAGVAERAVRVVFDVQQRRHGFSVGTPAAAAVDEVVRLRRAGGDAGKCEVVGAAHEARVPGTGVLGGKGGAAVAEAFGGFHVGETGAHGVLRRPIHRWLVAAHVQALNAGGLPGAFDLQGLGDSGRTAGAGGAGQPGFQPLAHVRAVCSDGGVERLHVDGSRGSARWCLSWRRCRRRRSRRRRHRRRRRRLVAAGLGAVVGPAVVTLPAAGVWLQARRPWRLVKLTAPVRGPRPAPEGRAPLPR